MDDPRFAARLSCENRKEFIHICSYAKGFNTQVQLRFNDKGINIQAMDGARVSMLNINISQDFFVSIVAHGVIGINVKILEQVLGMFEGEVKFEYDTTKSKLVVKDLGTSFEMICFNIDDEQLTFPEEEISRMTPVEFFGDGSISEMVDDIRKWTSKFKASDVKFLITEGFLTISTETMDTNISKKYNISGEGAWESKIRTVYFTQMPKTPHTITMYWLPDFPLMIEERGRHFNIQTFIAPMIEDVTGY